MEDTFEMMEDTLKMQLTRKAKAALRKRYGSTSAMLWTSPVVASQPSNTHLHIQSATPTKPTPTNESVSNYPASFLNKIGEKMLKEIIAKTTSDLAQKSKLNPQAVEFVSHTVSEAIVVPR